MGKCYFCGMVKRFENKSTQNFLIGKNNPEKDLTDSFVEFYLTNISKIHPRTSKTNCHIYTELPVSGYGIPDIITINSDDDAKSSSIVRAFEVKISDWRKALMQASRYRYFANASIVVLPDSKTNAARKFIETFKTLRIGLWGFDKENGVLHKYYTPHPSKPYSNNAFVQLKFKIAQDSL